MILQKYIEKKFHHESLRLIKIINEVVEDYQNQGYNLTLRQLYYQLVARDIIPNQQRSYKHIGNLVNDGRLSGLIPWDAIEDRTRFLRGHNHVGSVGETLENSVYRHFLDRWAGQQYAVEVWVEKDALVDIVGQACSASDVDYFSCRGYVSQTEMWNAANRIRRRFREHENVVILHLGDHDPSGKDMSRDMEDRLNLFGAYPEFNRIALNMDQIEDLSPPPNPTKLTDSRAQGYISQFGHECWELDALEPQYLHNLITREIDNCLDKSLYNDVLRQQMEERSLIGAMSQNVNEINDYLVDTGLI